MPKRSVQYIKGNEPAFLRIMKEQTGYVEPDTVEAKKAKADVPPNDSSDITKADEKPQVVVLSSGDLTEEQAAYHERWAETKPREVGNEKVIFKKPDKQSQTEDSTKEADHKNTKDLKKKKLKAVKNKSLLSFAEEDD